MTRIDRGTLRNWTQFADRYDGNGRVTPLTVDSVTIEGLHHIELAMRILEETRTQLMMSLRFLDRALWKMPFVPVVERILLSSDCQALYFNPMRVIECYRAQPKLMVRTHLHTLLHCIFRHPLPTVRANATKWSIACDMSIEAIAMELCGQRYPLETDETVAYLVNELAESEVPVTPASIYRELLTVSQEEFDNRFLSQFTDIAMANLQVGRDSHMCWELIRPEDVKHDWGGNEGGAGTRLGGQTDEAQDDNSSEGGVGAKDEGEEDDRSLDSTTGDQTASSGARVGADDDQVDEPVPGEGDESEDEEALRNQLDQAKRGGGGSGPMAGVRPSGKSSKGGPSEQSEEAPYEERSMRDVPSHVLADDLAEEWEEIAQQLQTALETLERKRGAQSGRLVANLALANRSRIDYASFLRRFATHREDVQINDEEFDYLFYTYGLNLYGNMPLIEPLEYRDAERVREFVIAIDTSGSCSHGLVNVFLTRTYEILSQISRRGERTNIHIIQCDAEVQSDTVIESVDDLLEFEVNLEARGMGGTDFRPVFAYVKDLVDQHVFEDLRGLVYFTDGFGTFPDRAPFYDVMFVFVENEGRERRVPPWAMKVVMDDDAIVELDGRGRATVL